MDQQLYQYLLNIAANRSYIRYSDAGAILNLNMNEPADRDEISRLLDEISEHEHHAGRSISRSPPLSFTLDLKCPVYPIYLL